MSARIRTGYSFRRAAGKLEDVLARIQEIGLAAAPITDSTAFGWSRWFSLCAAAKLKPVYGVEVAVKIGEGAKRPIHDHWTFIAKTSVVPLNRLIALATQQFHYEPVVTIEQALAVPDVFIITGHRCDLSKIEPRHDLFAGLSPASVPGWLRRASAHAFCAVSANRYAFEHQKPLYEAVAGKFAESQSYPQHILSDEEWLAALPGIATREMADLARANRDMVLQESNATLPQGSLPIPERHAPLRSMCEAGAPRLGVDISNLRYRERLDHELALIEEKGFADYFRIVADICAFARQHMLVGPARGSSCGSLVCYLLGITTVDPIPFGLLFERFIDTSRDDLPDIDIDFSEQHRDLVFEYVRQRYGADHVARLGTVNYFQARSALKETCFALNIPPWITEPLISNAEAHNIGYALDADQSGTVQKYPELRLAPSLENHPRHAGQHAAGVILTREAIGDIVAIDRHDGINVTQCDKLDAETRNLLKVDCLGLTQLSVFEHALKLAKLPLDHLFKIGFDDPKAFAVLNNKQFASVFQFNGKTIQGVSEAITVENINDIVTILAVGRPGPLDSGTTQAWIRARRENKAEHSALNDILPETFGLIVYQEDVMRICREIGKMDWPAVNALRRIISKTQGVEEAAKFKELFIAGAVQKMQHQDAEELWRHIVTFGKYGFNKSHSVAYGIVAYWCCWFKAHYPVEYAAATLSHENEEKQLTMLREMERENVPFIPADPKLSTDKWTVNIVDGRRVLLGPLTNIAGIGPAHCSEILGARVRGTPLSSAAAKALSRCLFKIPSTSPIATRIKELLAKHDRNIVTHPAPIKEVQPNGSRYHVMVFARIDSMRVQDENAPELLAKRGGNKFAEPNDKSLKLWISDDEDKIWCKVPRDIFPEIGQYMLDKGRAGNALYAIKGYVFRGPFRGMDVVDVKYIGDMEQDDVQAQSS